MYESDRLCHKGKPGTVPCKGLYMDYVGTMGKWNLLYYIMGSIWDNTVIMETKVETTILL